jgi:hypothetical protein
MDDHKFSISSKSSPGGNLPLIEPVVFSNPYRPGAGHMPPHLAGRDAEQDEFGRLLDQSVILENAVLTGLRGVGKTVLLETLKPIAVKRGWLWAGTDLSEAASVTEENMAVRLLTDLAVVTSSVVLRETQHQAAGFGRTPSSSRVTLDFAALRRLFDGTPGLVEDKVKAVLETAWRHLATQGHVGVIFAYDEAQNLSDNASRDQHPLSMLLDVFQSVQRKGIPMMLVLAGLPTLFPKLVEARTFAERMFRVVTLGKLAPEDSREAIDKPLNDAEPRSAVRFTKASIDVIVDESGGYPYFIQFMCREAFDAYLQQLQAGETPSAVRLEAITRKLDSDFFAGRWARATDRQRELLWVVAHTLASSDGEFSVQEVVAKSRELSGKPFGGSHANQMLSTLCAQGFIYKNRHGRYSLAVPLLDRFIRRQLDPDELG